MNNKRSDDELSLHREQTTKMGEWLDNKVPHPSDDLQELVRDMKEAENAIRRAMKRTSIRNNLQITLGYLLDDLVSCLQCFDPGDDD